MRRLTIFNTHLIQEADQITVCATAQMRAGMIIGSCVFAWFTGALTFYFVVRHSWIGAAAMGALAILSVLVLGVSILGIRERTVLDRAKGEVLGLSKKEPIPLANIAGIEIAKLQNLYTLSFYDIKGTKRRIHSAAQFSHQAEAIYCGQQIAAFLSLPLTLK